MGKDLNSSLIQLMADLRSLEETTAVLDELLSQTERVAMMKRLGIAVFLDQGWSYDKIRQSLKVSSATIASVQNRMGSPGLQIAIDKIKVIMLADNWSEKLTKIFPFIRVRDF